MTDYKKAANRVRELLGHIHPETDHNLDAAAVLCEAAAKASEGIDPDEERAHCERVARGWAEARGTGVWPWPTQMLAHEREGARTQAVLAAHVAYKELTDALAEFFYCGDPDDLKRVERAYDKVRDL